MRVNNPKIIGSFNRLNDEYDVLHQLVTVDQVQAMIETALGLDIPSSSMVPLYSLRKDPLSKYLYINQNGIGVSGITDEIHKAVVKERPTAGDGIYLEKNEADDDQIRKISINLGEPGQDRDKYLTFKTGPREEIILTTTGIDDTISSAVSSVRNEAVAIQPFQFSTEQMEKVGISYTKEIQIFDQLMSISYQKFSYDIPAYGFEVIDADHNQLIITDIEHLENGDTRIFAELPWDEEENKVILNFGMQGDLLTKNLGQCTFKVMSFVQNNGNKINIKQIIVC